VELVLPTVGHALGLTQLDPKRALDALAAHLADRPTLLVLDNLEHVLSAAPDVATLLARCPGLVVLGTSRAPLRVRPEQDYPLAPLAVPDATDVAAVASAPAAQVFLDRARAAAPGLRLTAATAPAVAAICRRLDGLPLALELAAAHARLLPPAALLDRLDSSLGLARSRDLPERQRTMAATLDWSHDLLTRNEQRLLRRLSVFVGGFTLVAAEQVAAEHVAVEPGGGSHPTDVFEGLAGLVEQSLVTPEPGVEARYRMLEPVREYAADRLGAAGETDELRSRHAAYVVELGRQARDGLRGADQAGWLDRLERDHGNLRVAVATLTDRHAGGSLARLGGDTWLYWALRGHAGEGLAWMGTVVGEVESARLTTGDRAAAYLALAGLRYAGGDVPGTRAAAERSVQAGEAADAGPVLTEALLLLGGALVFEGDLSAAAGPLAEAVRRAEQTEDVFALAQAKFIEGQRLFRASSLSEADTQLAEAEAIARRAGLPFSLATVLNMRAVVAEVSGDDDAALAQLTEAAELAAEVGTTWTLVYTLPALAVLAARRSQLELAALLFAAGRATAETSGLAVSFPPSREGAEHWLAVVRTSVHDETWQRAQEAGRTLPPADVADLARQLSRPAPS
jgi:predicted ATPase